MPRNRAPRIINNPPGERITEWRRHYFRERVTRNELANRSGIGYATLTRWENDGTANADPYRLAHLVDVMRGMQNERRDSIRRRANRRSN